MKGITGISLHFGGKLQCSWMLVDPERRLNRPFAWPFSSKCSQSARKGVEEWEWVAPSPADLHRPVEATQLLLNGHVLQILCLDETERILLGCVWFKAMWGYLSLLECSLVYSDTSFGSSESFCIYYTEVKKKQKHTAPIMCSDLRKKKKPSIRLDVWLQEAAFFSDCVTLKCTEGFNPVWRSGGRGELSFMYWSSESVQWLSTPGREEKKKTRLVIALVSKESR